MAYIGQLGLTSLVGKRFGRLVVLESLGYYKKQRHWLVQCDCGNYREMPTRYLQALKRSSCGRCKDAISYTHPLYPTWANMMQRCYNKNNPAYYRYGGRSITVAKEWREFYTFVKDMSPKPEGYSLERINNDKGYSKDNCKWATPLEQANNRSPRNSLKD